MAPRGVKFQPWGTIRLNAAVRIIPDNTITPVRLLLLIFSILLYFRNGCEITKFFHGYPLFLLVLYLVEQLVHLLYVLVGIVHEEFQLRNHPDLVTDPLAQLIPDIVRLQLDRIDRFLRIRRIEKT